MVNGNESGGSCVGRVSISSGGRADVSDNVSLVNLVTPTPFISYFGGKMQARKILRNYMPSDVKLLVSPFLGGGSFELYCTGMGIRVLGYDAFAPMVKLWHIMLEDAYSVFSLARRLYPQPPCYLRDLIVSEKIHSLDVFPEPASNVLWASLVLCMTKQGYNTHPFKTTYFKSKNNSRLPKVWSERYLDWRNNMISVSCQTYEKTLLSHRNDFIFCDPPYIGGEHYYGAYNTRKTSYPSLPEFDHEHFAELLLSHSGRFLLTYQDDPDGIVRKLYKGLNIHEHTWPQSKYPSPIELIITNF